MKTELLIKVLEGQGHSKPNIKRMIKHVDTGENIGVFDPITQIILNCFIGNKEAGSDYKNYMSDSLSYAIDQLTKARAIILNETTR